MRSRGRLTDPSLPCPLGASLASLCFTRQLRASRLVDSRLELAWQSGSARQCCSVAFVVRQSRRSFFFTFLGKSRHPTRHPPLGRVSRRAAIAVDHVHDDQDEQAPRSGSIRYGLDVHRSPLAVSPSHLSRATQSLASFAKCLFFSLCSNSYLAVTS